MASLHPINAWLEKAGCKRDDTKIAIVQTNEGAKTAIVTSSVKKGESLISVPLSLCIGMFIKFQLTHSIFSLCTTLVLLC